ncbi:MAG: glycosyltransferase [Clostridia bacterium]|nr:glycosyltransferase [Clostridia bacterium]
MKKVLILYAKYGGGHLSAANAIKSYIENNYTDTEVRSVDCVEYFNKFISNVTTGAYKKMAKKAPNLWKKIYYGSTDGFLSHVSNFTNKLMAKKLKKLFNEYNPDTVISVHPFGTPITSYLKNHEGINCKLAVVFTDFAPHEQWLVGKEECDYFFVSNEVMKQALIDNYNIASDKIHVTGIPLSSAFSSNFNDGEIIEKYNLNKDKKLILFFGGGEFGLGENYTVQILKELTQYIDKYQIVAVSGRNKKMYNEFINLSNELKSNDLHTLDYCTDVPALMHMSSLVVTKPGGLTSSESLASHLPILIINPIPGQEEENAEFLVNAGAAIWLKKEDDIQQVINSLLNNESKLEELRNNSTKIAKPDSTKQICEIILN